jgi:hypothetical protein
LLFSRFSFLFFFVAQKTSKDSRNLKNVYLNPFARLHLRQDEIREIFSAQERRKEKIEENQGHYKNEETVYQKDFD